MDDRVSVLEVNLDRLQGEVEAKVSEYRLEFIEIKKSVEREGSKWRAEARQLAGEVEKLAVGGLHLEMVGLLWLLVGVLGTSLPDELASLLSFLLAAPG